MKTYCPVGWCKTKHARRIANTIVIDGEVIKGHRWEAPCLKRVEAKAFRSFRKVLS